MSGSEHHADDWVHSERRSFRLALAITLLPIPAALLFSWMLGDPPWRARPDRDPHQINPAPTDGPEHRPD